MSERVAAIIPAGGSGERLPELGMPKQFYEIGGKPLIGHAAAAFENCVDIDVIVFVVSEIWRDKIPGIGKFRKFAEPGKTRQHSIYNGMLALKDVLHDDDVVVIHDAARPLVTELDISRCISAVGGYDGATPYLLMQETVYGSANGETITASLNRDELRVGQTPEAYLYGKYLAAHEDIDLSNVRGSSELAFHAGMRICLYPGNRRNIKITTKEDMEYFMFLRERVL
jgi:2-C-methyl-D-erythritol 4-phosphate cytidylyltransferase